MEKRANRAGSAGRRRRRLRLAEDGARILIRRAKNDPLGDRRSAHISAHALAHLDRWLEVADLSKGPIFRPIAGRNVQARALPPFNRTLKRLAAEPGLPDEVARSLSGHSMRVGAAQDLMVAGRSLLQITTAGDWSESLQRGGRRAARGEQASGRNKKATFRKPHNNWIALTT
jgi:hypothetical protein